MSEKIITIPGFMFEHLAEKIKMPAPGELIHFYADQPRLENDFTRTLDDICNKSRTPHFIVQISEHFAKRIIVHFENLDRAEEEQLRDSIVTIDPENLPDFETTLSYLLIEGINLYDIRSNHFQIPLIQSAYQDLNSNTNQIKLVLCTWVHCGGWGGVIFRGRNMGYEAGGCHGEYLKVEHRGHHYDYNSNIYEHSEKPHIETLKTI